MTRLSRVVEGGSMGLLDDRAWDGKIFSGGWVDGSGGTSTDLAPSRS